MYWQNQSYEKYIFLYRVYLHETKTKYFLLSNFRSFSTTYELKKRKNKSEKTWKTILFFTSHLYIYYSNINIWIDGSKFGVAWSKCINVIHHHHRRRRNQFPRKWVECHRCSIETVQIKRKIKNKTTTEKRTESKRLE